MRNCTASRGCTTSEQKLKLSASAQSSVSHRRGIAVGEDRGGSRATANHANYVRLDATRIPTCRCREIFRRGPRRLKIILNASRPLPDAGITELKDDRPLESALQQLLHPFSLSLFHHPSKLHFAR